MVQGTRVLIGSTIRQTPEILKEFLLSLNELDKIGIIVDYFFIDDNKDEFSSTMLEGFRNNNLGEVIVERGEASGEYVCSDETHLWKGDLIHKVAEYKNKIISFCKREKYDYLFLIDSDLVLNTKTLTQLLTSEKDIISEIFWTRWKKDSEELPQVWLYDQYSLIPKSPYESLTEDEINTRYYNFLQQLRQPGTYEIGGLGACTLISRKAIEAGVNFDEIYNVSFWGEDRHFCIRAAVLGFKLYVDTNCPAYHIYRTDDIQGVREYKLNYKSYKNSTSNKNLNSEIRDYTREFIRRFYSCDYRVVTGFEGVDYLSPQYRKKLAQAQEGIVKHLVHKKVNCKADIGDISIEEIKNSGKKFMVDCKIIIENRTKDIASKMHFSCKLFIKKQDKTQWFIEDIELFNSNEKPLIGFSLVDLLDERVRINKDKNNKITLAMLVRNESKKFLDEVLGHAAQYIDNAVILDDASEDNTVEICKEVLKDIPLTIVSNPKTNFSNEILLRKQLWNITTAANPDWILCLDADEVFEEKIKDNISLLINQSNYDYYCFRLFDMWNNSCYREDRYWQAHNYFRPFLIRHQPSFNYEWNELPLHCGRMPKNVTSLKGCLCEIRLKHLGWSNEKLREEKYRRYIEIDPEGKYGILKQYQSILDKYPRLVPWN